MDVVRSIDIVFVGFGVVSEVAMTTKEIMMLQRLKLFSIGRMFIPVTISLRYVKNSREKVYEWYELRIFGFLIAMWGAIG